MNATAPAGVGPERASSEPAASRIQPPVVAIPPLWRRVLAFKIRIVPLSVYLPFFALMVLLMSSGRLPKDMLGALAVMALLGYLCGEIGNRIPILKDVGGAPIMATFLPSYLVFAKLLPDVAVTTVTSFMKTSNFLYVYIAMVIVGSILGMNRTVMLKAFAKMFVPLVAATFVATGVGLATGALMGLPLSRTFFYIVVPIMAGGVGEGAIPLSMGYAGILGVAQEDTFAQVLPVVMLGSLTAIILSGLLKRLGEKRPELSGEGRLVKEGAGDDETRVLEAATETHASLDLSQMAVGGVMALGFYLLGVSLAPVTGIPGPITMLFTCVVVKALGWLPRELEEGAYMIHRFFVVGVTFPLLLAVGVAMTPWASLVAVLTPSILLTIVATVVSIVASGFFVGQWMKMYPVEAAIVTACHSGQGGTGDVAILTASDRLVLMPFAQVSTRVGGAAMVTFAIFLLRWVTAK
ncbi:MAG TPA: 2-hydroxycarboxylate transporter family protein [Vicinamibacterales bacterium]|jgi:CCS family citrate carrier protein